MVSIWWGERPREPTCVKQFSRLGLAKYLGALNRTVKAKRKRIEQPF